MGRSRFNVCSVRNPSKTDVVGIFVGYHGTRHLLCYLWNCHGCLRLFRFDQRGKFSFVFFKHPLTLILQEYVLTDVKDRQHLLTFHKKAKKLGLDLNQYNQLKDQITKVELDLKKLRNPLRLRLPPTATAPKEAPATPPEEKPPSSKE